MVAVSPDAENRTGLEVSITDLVESHFRHIVTSVIDSFEIGTELSSEA